jgi:RNase H-fold protein (predicted Holliday junction resolvase)
LELAQGIDVIVVDERLKTFVFEGKLKERGSAQLANDSQNLPR